MWLCSECSRQWKGKKIGRPILEHCVCCTEVDRCRWTGPHPRPKVVHGQVIGPPVVETVGGLINQIGNELYNGKKKLERRWRASIKW